MTLLPIRTVISHLMTVLHWYDIECSASPQTLQVLCSSTMAEIVGKDHSGPVYSPARSATRTIIVSSGSDCDETVEQVYPSTPLRTVARTISWSNMDALTPLSLDDGDRGSKTPKRTKSKASLDGVIIKKVGEKKKTKSSKLSLSPASGLESRTETMNVSKKGTTTPKSTSSKDKVTRTVDAAFMGLVEGTSLVHDSTESESASPKRIIKKKSSSRSTDSSSTDSSTSRARSKSPFHRVVERITIRKSKGGKPSSEDCTVGDYSSSDLDRSGIDDSASVVSERSSRGRSRRQASVETKVADRTVSSPGAIYKSRDGNGAYPVSPHRSMQPQLDGRVSPRRTTSAPTSTQLTTERIEASSYFSPQRGSKNPSIVKSPKEFGSKGDKTPIYGSPAKMMSKFIPTSDPATPHKPASILKTPTYSKRHVDTNVSPEGVVDNSAPIIMDNETTERSKYRSIRECLGEYDKIVNEDDQGNDHHGGTW
jgi:hypothetical protein